MQKSTDADEAIAGAYYIVQLLPLDPDQAEAILAAVEDALTYPGSPPDGWTGPASHVYSHLRKRKPETADATLAVARDIIEAVRPHFAGA
jgi:hypothetical protein